jgi:uncharacterized protein with GYD domain
MPKFLVKANYTADGAKGIIREGGSGRRAAIDKALQAVGGRMEAFYFAFGDVDAYVIADLPDNATAAAVALAVGQAGLASTQTVVLLTPEEVDAASKKAVPYRPPGG